MDVDLQKIWDVELEILDQIDAFCRKHGLKYSLAYGTLIGAVRHGGFIPWDDDVDIVMPREDYEYLLSHWDIPGFVLQNKRTNNDFNQNFSKVRKDHTTFIQNEFEKSVSYHTGIFVDIFPGDRVAPEGLQRKVQHFCCALDLLYSREFVSGGRSSLVEKAFLAVPRKWRLKLIPLLDKEKQAWNTTESEYFFPSTINDMKIYYLPELFSEMVEIEFADRKYMCVKSYDSFLREYYGDYMQYPPEEQRLLKHHPIIIDAEKNYSEM